MSRGLFVVLEGIEGAGKTTQNRRLARWLEARGRGHRAVREPGGTPLGERVREILLRWRDDDVSPESELFLLLAARAAFVRDVVRPALQRDEVVLADRYELSTFAYQGYGRGLELSALRRANRLATGGLRPDVCVLLDVEVEEGLDRRRRDGGEDDRIEAAGTEFLRRVKDGYRALARSEDRVVRVDGSAPVDEVQAEVRRILTRRFPETFGDS